MKLPVNYNHIHWSMRKVVRQEYIKIQNNVCQYCKESLKKDPPLRILTKSINKELFPKGFFDWPIHLHHNHETGMTIGAVHNYCNAVLWQYHNE